MAGLDSPTPEQVEQEKALKESLKEAGISFKEHRHAKSRTLEELSAAVASLGIPICKNLFLKDKKGQLYLFTALQDSPTPMKGLMAKLGTQKLRLADEKLLQQTLQVLPGCVNPFAVLNDAKKSVTLLLDKKLEGSEQHVLLHPMHNCSSIEIAAKDAISFLIAKGVAITFIDCEELQALADSEDGQSPTAAGSAAAAAAAAAANGIKKEPQQHETTLGITAKKASNFSEWYTQVITRGELVEYYDISGCYIIRPWAYRLWEAVQKMFDDGIKKLGVENCYFPMFVSKTKLEKEKAHIEGFSPEVAWVTHYGDSRLQEKVAIRPTSETIMYPAYAKWIRSHRDLPLKLNQWCNVVRWEFKQPTPFLRTREFLWQEGHTAHATEEEAYELVLQILELYRQWYEDYLAVPVIKGEKSENEKFAGGKKTTTIESFIAETGRGIQAATSHLLGQNFSKMFGIEFEDEKGDKQLVHQTSWGCTTRSLGVMIMTHGDDKGLVLPPKVAALQAVFVPILFKESDASGIVSKCRELEKELKTAGIRVKVDDRTNYTPGWKFNDWELKGVPLRLEIGPRDLQQQQTRVVRRDTGEALQVPWVSLGDTVSSLLEEIQINLFNKAKEKMDKGIEKVLTFEEVMPVLNRKHLVLAPWCEDPESETEIKKETQRLSEAQGSGVSEGLTGAMKPLCLPFDQPDLPPNTKCFFTGKPAKRWCLFGRSY